MMVHRNAKRGLAGRFALVRAIDGGMSIKAAAAAFSVSPGQSGQVLKRAGISRSERPPREPANGSEWPCPGDLPHVDVSRYARFERPGHAFTGARPSAHQSRPIGRIRADLGRSLRRTAVPKRLVDRRFRHRW
jgi:hypothetical protein